MPPSPAVVGDGEVAREVGSHDVRVERWVQPHLALDGAGIRVEEQLGRVVALRAVWSPLAVGAEGVALPDPHVRDGAEPSAVGPVA